jgi:hypothetical protein
MIKITDKLVDKISPSKLDPAGLGNAYWKFWSGVMQKPGKFMLRNLELAAKQAQLVSYGLSKATGSRALARRERRTGHLESQWTSE